MEYTIYISRKGHSPHLTEVYRVTATNYRIESDVLTFHQHVNIGNIDAVPVASFSLYETDVLRIVTSAVEQVGPAERLTYTSLSEAAE